MKRIGRWPQPGQQRGPWTPHRNMIRNARLRTFCLFGLLLMVSSFIFLRRPHGGLPAIYVPKGAPSTSRKRHPQHDNLLLTQQACSIAFPDLFHEIDRAKSQGPFDLYFRERVAMQARIVNNELYILCSPGSGDLSAIMLHRQSATINQIYRAIKTSPEPLPNVSFTIDAQDQPFDGSMSFARPISSPSNKRIFPMPHFSFWSWPLPFVGSLPAASRAISDIEDGLRFEEKNPRAVWRGTTWFNNGAGPHPRLRHDLLAKIGGETSWADVQKLEWNKPGSREGAANALKIEDFCRHKYIIHTEGIGYSGRLQFHQLCQSVILSPPLEWMQHTTHLIRPVHSSSIFGTEGRLSKYPTRYERELWPDEYPPEEANMIFVASDWSDLEDTVRWLDDHQDIAAGIASRQRATYYTGGYLSPAAETCYWRALLRGWSEVARPIGEEWEQPGIPFEEYISGHAEGR